MQKFVIVKKMSEQTGQDVAETQVRMSGYLKKKRNVRFLYFLNFLNQN